MFYFLLVILILDALLLSVVVLLQAGQGGGLASLGGSGTTDTFVGGRQAVTILTKATWWCGGIFLALSLLLSFVPRTGGGSALQEKIREAAPSAPPVLPGTAPAPAAQPPAAEQPAAPAQKAPQTATPPPASQPKQ
jgi:preprotein translocase subunit SecG